MALLLANAMEKEVVGVIVLVVSKIWFIPGMDRLPLNQNANGPFLDD